MTTLELALIAALVAIVGTFGGAMFAKFLSDKLYLRQETFDEYRKGLDKRLTGIENSQTSQTKQLNNIERHLSKMEGRLCTIATKEKDD